MTPAQAITLLSFRERSEWGEAELAEQTGQTPAMARRNASFWVQQGRLWGIVEELHIGLRG